MKAVKKSRSLQAVHISGNQIDKKTQNAIRDIMKPMRFVPSLYEKINKNDDLPNIDAIESMITQPLTGHLKREIQKFDEEQQKKLEDDFEEKGDKNEDAGEKLVYQRFLGHFEIPKSYKWLESETCWQCEKYGYTLVICSKSICERFFTQPRIREKKAYISKIKAGVQNALDNDFQEMYENQLNYDAETLEQKYQDKRNLKIASSFNKWLPQSMIPLGQFIELLKKNFQPQIREIKLMKHEYEKLVAENKVNKEAKVQVRGMGTKLFITQQTSTYKKLVFSQDKEESEWQDVITEKDRMLASRNQIQQLAMLLKKLNVPINTLIDLPIIQQMDVQSNFKMSGLEEKLYAFATYLPSGKHQSVLLHNIKGNAKDLKHFVTIVRNHKTVKYPLRQKAVKKYNIDRQFVRSISVFKDWQENTEQFLKKCFEYDCQYWKISRFIKDQLELRRTCDVVQKYYAQIYEVFIDQTSKSSYPSITWIDFCNWCEKCKIPDNKTCTMQTVDRLFIATNVELVELEDNPDRDLCRFEFFEIIVRLGAAKYKDSHQCSTYDKAVEMVIQNCILKNYQLRMMDGERFRRQYVWTLPIDDLYKANLTQLQKVFDFLCKKGQKFIDKNDILELFEKQFNLNEEAAITAFAFSKQIIL